jgi:hypothetical protein
MVFQVSKRDWGILKLFQSGIICPQGFAQLRCFHASSERGLYDKQDPNSHRRGCCRVGEHIARPGLRAFQFSILFHVYERALAKSRPFADYFPPLAQNHFRLFLKANGLRGKAFVTPLFRHICKELY